jgi:hypothetical protein
MLKNIKDQLLLLMDANLDQLKKIILLLLIKLLMYQ